MRDSPRLQGGGAWAAGEIAAGSSVTFVFVGRETGFAATRALSVCLSVCLCVCLSVFLSVYLCVCMSVILCGRMRMLMMRI